MTFVPPTTRRTAASFSTAQHSGGVIGSQSLLPGGTDGDLAFDGLVVTGGGGGAHEGPVIVGGLEQAGHEFGRVLVDGGGLGLQAQIDLEPFGDGVAAVGLPPAALAGLAGQRQQYPRWSPPMS